MDMDKVETVDEDREWFLMRHLDPALIDMQLRHENERRTRMGKSSLLYVIPYQYIKKAQQDKLQNDRYNKEVKKNNLLRNDFHFFVFIKATRTEITELVQSPWNTFGRVRLHHCRSHAGEPLRVKHDEMDRLIKLFVEQREKFNFVPAEDDVRLKEKVQLKTGIFKDYEASVLKIKYSADGANFTLGIPVFNGEYTLQMKNYKVSDIKVPSRLQKYLDPSFVSVMECDLIEILRHRIKGYPPGADRTLDADKLNAYYLLNYLDFTDVAKHRHFKTLMLFCASLRKDKTGKEILIPVVETFVGNKNNVSTDEDAFAFAILFEATHNVDYRTLVKNYVKTHTVTLAPLTSIMPLIKGIRVRK